MSIFQELTPAAPDPAFYLLEQFKLGDSAHKVGLTPGFYRDGNAQPWVFVIRC